MTELTVTIPESAWFTSNRFPTNRGHHARMGAEGVTTCELCPFVGCKECAFQGQKNVPMWDNESGPTRCVNTKRGLTHSSGLAERG